MDKLSRTNQLDESPLTRPCTIDNDDGRSTMTIDDRRWPIADRRRYGLQSAMNTFVSPSTFQFRFDPKTSFFPSGENIGKPSKVSLKVTCSRPLPSRFTR